MKNNIKKIALIFLGSLISFFFVVNSVFVCNAQNLSNWQDNLQTGGGMAGFDTNLETPEPFISVIIKTALSFLGVLFLILMIYGGFLWMTARGNEEQVTKSKNLIIAAVIGLIIVLASYAISSFVVGSLSEEALDFI